MNSVKEITRYQADDGSEHTTREQACHRNTLINRVRRIMEPLGPVNPDVKDGKGWVQHELETVNRVKDDFLDLCRELELHKSYPVFNNPGRDCHPFCAIGRILCDVGGPLNDAWCRFMCIDVYGREHQQPYFAYTHGPDGKHVCVENRSDKPWEWYDRNTGK